MLNNLLFHIRTHRWALCLALLVGVISIGPHALFKMSLGAEYQGLYILQTDNETEYLAKVQEIFDGHPLLGSTPFFEYKNSFPLLPPTLELFYAFAALVFGASIPAVFIASKFVLPAILFFLVYLLIYRLSVGASIPRGKAHALAGGLLIVLGYGLIDYGTVWSYLNSSSSPASFLLWTRPVNPVIGAILLYSVLLIAWSFHNEHSRHYRFFLYTAGGVALALMIGSYFFSWFLTLSVIGILAMVNALRHRYAFVKRMLLMSAIGIILSLPYWYIVWNAGASPFYADAAFRTGFAFGHSFILNKFLIFSIIAFFGATFLFRLEKKEWWWFCAALLLGSFVAFNQQVITGRTIWPFHFVQYTVPLSLSVLFVVFFHACAQQYRWAWSAVVGFVIVISLSFGIYVQASVYNRFYDEYKQKQSYAAVFRWLNASAPKDCVVLSEDDLFSRMILAFTHCNVYLTSNTHFLIPFDRLRHNYLTYLRLKGISAEEIEQYFANNTDEALAYLYGLGGLQASPSSPLFVKSKQRLPIDYKNFLSNDFRKELEKYRIDYIISQGSLNEEVRQSLNGLVLVSEINVFFVYEIVKNN